MTATALASVVVIFDRPLDSDADPPTKYLIDASLHGEARRRAIDKTGKKEKNCAAPAIREGPDCVKL